MNINYINGIDETYARQFGQEHTKSCWEDVRTIPVESPMFNHQLEQENTKIFRLDARAISVESPLNGNSFKEISELPNTIFQDLIADNSFTTEIAISNSSSSQGAASSSSSKQPAAPSSSSKQPAASSSSSSQGAAPSSSSKQPASINKQSVSIKKKTENSIIKVLTPERILVMRKIFNDKIKGKESFKFIPLNRMTCELKYRVNPKSLKVNSSCYALRFFSKHARGNNEFQVNIDEFKEKASPEALEAITEMEKIASIDLIKGKELIDSKKIHVKPKSNP